MRILLLVSLLLGAVRFAAAQPSDADRKEAKAAFARAEAAERRKDWRTAIDEYQRAYDLAPHPDVLYNIAVDLERLEEYRDAATHYRRYLDQSEDPADAPRVEALIEKLRARPGLVTITTDPPGAEVAIDGKRAGAAPVERRLAGTHRIEVSGDAGSARREINVEFGEPQTVHVAIAARAGTLVVTSNVPGAEVVIDGEPAGTTPASLALPAGSHRVVVRAEGWSSYDRPVEIHAEGTTQMTANLVRPLGYVEPTPVDTTPRGFISVGGGADTTGENGSLYTVMFGAHRGHFDFGLGYGFASQAAAFALETRASFTLTKVRPYVRAQALLGGSSSISGHAGMLGYLFPTTGRARTALFVDIGIGVVRTGTSTDGEAERVLTIPFTAGVQLSY